MTTLILIAVIVILLSAIIAKFHHDEKLFTRLLFCFCVSICISAGMKQLFLPEQVEIINSTSNSKIEGVNNSHTVDLDSIARTQVMPSGTVGKEFKFPNLTRIYSLNYVPFIMPLMIKEHIIFDSS